MTRIIFVFILFVSCQLSIRGQSEMGLPEGWLESLVENLDDDENASLNIDQVIEELTFLSQHPININVASKEDLSELIFLTDFQIISLIDYRKKYGYFQSIHELQYAYGFDRNLITRIAPFITIVNDAKNLKPARNQGIYLVRFHTVLENQSGYLSQDGSSPKLEGNKYKLYQKFRYSGQQIQVAMVNEKDAGESFFAKSNKQGFDFNSMYMRVQNKKGDKQLLVGDYVVRYGQGVNLWQGYSPPKSTLSVDRRRKGESIRGNTGSDENSFMRGIAVLSDHEQWDFSAFYSNKNIDANLTSSDSGNYSGFSSFQTSGLHATEGEIADEKGLKEVLFGGRAGFSNNWMKMGINYLHFTYGKPYLLNIRPYNQFEYTEKQGDKISFDYYFQANRFNLFGEHAVSSTKSIASLVGMSYYLQSLAEVSVLIRDYPRNFIHHYSNAFGEGSKVQNEQGVCMSVMYSIIPGVSLSAYADYYRFPWLRYQVSAPSSGREYGMESTYWINRETSMSVRYKNESQYANTSMEDYPGFTRNKLDFVAKYTVHDHLRCKSGIHFTSINRTDKGYLMYQDVVLNLLDQKARVYGRYALFDTDNYDSRMYVYENDLLYAFSVPMFYDKGRRFYLMLNYRFKKQLQCWIKYSQTYYSNRNTIGTEPFRIDGPKKSDVKFQILYRL